MRIGVGRVMGGGWWMWMRFRAVKGGAKGFVVCCGWRTGRCWMDGCLRVIGGKSYENAWGVALVDGMIAL